MSTFTLRDLSMLCYARDFTLWHYSAAATISQACVPGFFDVAADVLARGDRIMVSALDGAVDLHVVSVSGGVVTSVVGRTGG